MKYSLSRFAVAPKDVKTAKRVLNHMAAAIQKHDPGLAYLVFQEPNLPTFVTLVSFQDEEAYRQHVASKHAAAFARKMAALCLRRPTILGLDLVTATTHTRAKPAHLSPRASRPARRSRRHSPLLGSRSRRRASA
jgi:quinol monooxygenase YgiN